jgi:hypothetical protein
VVDPPQHRRKGPRTGRPDIAPRRDEDRLGRPIRWQLDGEVAGALDARHLVVELDGQAKVYRRGDQQVVQALELALNWVAGTIP